MSDDEASSLQSQKFHILDGAQLRAVDLSLPQHHPGAALTGSQLLDAAHSKASSSLFGLPLPQPLTANALTRLRAANVHVADVGSFCSSQFDVENATHILRDYIAAIADELKDNPLVVSVLDGSTLRLYLKDEDDFAMLAEILFTDLDVEDKGKISKSEIQNALVKMGVDMGVPPFSDPSSGSLMHSDSDWDGKKQREWRGEAGKKFPQLDDLLRKHGADGEEKLGQAQFAQLLQSILQELAEELSHKNVVFIQNMKVLNGSKLRQLLANEKELSTIVEKMLQENPNAKDGKGSMEIIRNYLERNGKEFGLPPFEDGEARVILYADVFTDIEKEKEYDLDLEKGESVKLLRDILEKFAEQLESNPVLCQDFAC